MHRLLSSQLDRSRASESVDVARLCAFVNQSYEEFDKDRSRSERATRLMLSELDAINRDRDHALSVLRQEHQKLHAALSNMGHGVAMFDSDGTLLICNAQYLSLFAIPEPSGPISHAELRQHISDQLLEPELGPNYVGLFADEESRRAIDLDLKTGRRVSATFSIMPDDGWIEVYQDVTEQRDAARTIEFLAKHDPLTNLPNRRLFNEVITSECERVKRGSSIAILCLDLDHFKSINDTLGHPVGDQLLREVADRLRQNVRSIDTVARLGGDEFAIVQVEANQPEGATQLARRLIEELSRPYTINGHQMVIGTSIGISISPNDGTDADLLLKNADMALYRAKDDGRGTLRFFETGMDTAIQARREMEIDLRRAIKCAEFELHFQPLIDLSSNAINSCEALIRWNHPTSGRVPPDHFIGLAEEIGLIGEIGDWVLKQACRTAVRWTQPISVAVNISPVQFKSPSLVESVRAALHESGLPAYRLELEITEAVLLQDTDRTLQILHELRNLGVRIAMDDFGTGYSSLSYLRKFPFDKLKIDRSFVRDLGAANEAGAIVRAVTELATSLGMRTTAEGVETEHQREILEALNCSEIQGYLISRPVNSNEISVIISESDLQESAA